MKKNSFMKTKLFYLVFFISQDGLKMDLEMLRL